MAVTGVEKVTGMHRPDPRFRRGLSEEDAAERLRLEGPNELPSAERRTLAVILLEVLSEPMLFLLLAGGLLYVTLGDWVEGVILFAFASISVVITIMQETRTERVLQSLRALSSPRAVVIRNGSRRRLAGAEVVRGDLLVVAEGERVPADAWIIEAQDVLVDESLLTGESVPVRKSVSHGERHQDEPRPGGEDLPFLFSGSLVVRGTALAQVTATGPRSAIGRIGTSLEAVEREPPRLRQETTKAVRIFAIVGAAVSVLTVLLYATTRGDWLQAVLAGIAIGMSMLPEELPVVLTVFMAMGAWRISKARVLTRRMAAIEVLGSATVLCTDKTGTLTENRMTLAELRLPSSQRMNSFALGSGGIAFDDLLHTAVLASARNPIDPMEKAFQDAGQMLGQSMAGGELLHSFGLRPELLAVTHIWRMKDEAALLVAAKGAPEAIAGLCKMSEGDRAQLRAMVDAMATDGMRVLGVARGRWLDAALPVSPQEVSFDFLGLAGLEDPVRASVPAAVHECRTAGIRVVVITGDYPTTAAAIARQIGLPDTKVITGTEVEHMDSIALRAAVAGASVFARVMPEQKLAIVQALKANGEIVAMTGDGVNDAPSLKAAHIGIAMGGRGTDVAREASSIVLLDDDFSSIVQAVRLGRRIYDNLRKAVGFIFAVHVPIAGLALLPLVVGLPPLLGPVHIAFLEMIIDPVCSLVFEAEHAETDVMARPPRPPEQPLFSRALLAWGLLQGSLAFAVVVGTFGIAIARAMPEPEVRALCFFALVASIIGLIFVNRSFGASLVAAVAHPGPVLLLVLLIVSLVLAASLGIPSVAALFRFGPLHTDDLAIVAAGTAVLVTMLETVKLVFSYHRPERARS
jgi:Ca2+-transporting ATPase